MQTYRILSKCKHRGFAANLVTLERIIEKVKFIELQVP